MGSWSPFIIISYLVLCHIQHSLLQPLYNLFEEVASYGVCKNVQPLAMACWLSIFEILKLEAFMYFYVYTCKMKDSFISTAFICCCVDPNEVLNPRERCNKQAWHSKSLEQNMLFKKLKAKFYNFVFCLDCCVAPI